MYHVDDVCYVNVVDIHDFGIEILMMMCLEHMNEVIYKSIVMWMMLMYVMSMLCVMYVKFMQMM